MEYSEMIGFIHDDDLLTAQVLSPDNVVLSAEQLDWALAVSQSAEAIQWQTYLNLLARLGTKAWLQKRAPELAVTDWPAAEASSENVGRQISGQIGLTVEQSKLGLLMTDCLADPLVTIPTTVESDSLPDFYLLVEVLEELSEVRVWGYLPRTQLDQHLNQQSVQAEQAEPDAVHNTVPDTVLLPIDCFNADPNCLLLHLRTAAQMSSVAAASSFSQQAPQQALQQAMNVGLWLQNQLDQVAARAWILLSPAELNLSGALMGASMRGISGDLNLVVRELQRHQAMLIPADARVAYHDFQLAEAAARLYVLIWVPAREWSESPTWSMLLILGGQPERPAPIGLTLRVEEFKQASQHASQREEAAMLLAEATLEHDPYLYMQVVGAWDEQFRVSIVAKTGAALTLPIFEFNPDYES
jgi:hypothetical protein